MKVEYLNHMGDDLTVVNAARVSFDKESDWLYLDRDGEVIVGAQYWEDYPEKILNDKDEKLIQYLARHNHWTPFSHVQITLRETVPIFVARQRFKHMVGFTYNEVSRRYVDNVPEFYTPEKWRKRAENVKQGSSDEEVINYSDGFPINRYIREYYSDAQQTYKDLLEAGVAPEQARMVLPQSMYTSYYCTGSLAAFARSYKLRSDSHAQLEIQELARQWDKIIRPLFPVSWSALVDTDVKT